MKTLFLPCQWPLLPYALNTKHFSPYSSHIPHYTRAKATDYDQFHKVTVGSAADAVQLLKDAIEALRSLPNVRCLQVFKQTNRILRVDSSGSVSVLAGSGIASQVDGFGVYSSFNGPSAVGVTQSGIVFAGDANIIRQLTCVPCPTSYYCFSGAPVLCPAGSYCPLSSINATLCPKGSYSNAGASNCILCPAGTFISATGSTYCQQCPGGHFCPAGTSSWARLNCGRGNYCPDGSGAPTPCPFQVPPTGGWGALQVQGPAFLVETARCLNHCFWNFTSGDGMLSKC